MKSLNKLFFMTTLSTILTIFSAGASATTVTGDVRVDSKAPNHFGRVSMQNGTSGASECKGVLVQRPGQGTNSGSFSVNITQCTPVSPNVYRMKIEAQGALPAINDTKYLHILSTNNCNFFFHFGEHNYTFNVTTPGTCAISNEPPS